jgi:hypothetical protein
VPSASARVSGVRGFAAMPAAQTEIAGAWLRSRGSRDPV